MNFYEVDSELNRNHDIQGFWSLEEGHDLYNAEAIIPDSSVEVVFNCGALLMWKTKDGSAHELPRVFIKGVQRRPLILRTCTKGFWRARSSIWDLSWMDTSVA